MIKVVSLACDHAAYELKEQVKEYLVQNGTQVIDCGANSSDSVDYPDMAKLGCDNVLSGKAQAAILLCGTGVGISIAANKIKGIRACCCSDVFSAKHSRLHNNANALCIGARVVGFGTACNLVDAFLSAEFEGGRHANRVDKMMNFEDM